MIISIKTLLFIGAGAYQVKGILKAKELGFRIIAVDEDPCAIGFDYVDNFLNINIFEHAEIIEFAKNENVFAALSVSSDICLETVAVVNEALGFSSMTLDQIRMISNKGLMRKKLYEFGLKDVNFFTLKKISEISKALKVINFPLVVKPVDSSGSRGVSYVKNHQELISKCKAAFDCSRTNEILLEEYMDGDEVAIDGFVIDGELVVLSISDKIRTSPPYLLDTEVIFPSLVPNNIKQEIEEILTKVIKILEINNCPIHIEMMITKEGVKIVEIAVRGAGFKVYTDIVPYISGVDTLLVQIKLLLGEDVVLNKSFAKKAVCLKFLDSEAGILKDVSGIEEAKKIEGVEEIKIYPKIGDKVNKLTCGADRLGHIVTYGENYHKVRDKAKKAEQWIGFEIIKD
jgi:biotin carboxylase